MVAVESRINPERNDNHNPTNGHAHDISPQEFLERFPSLNLNEVNRFEERRKKKTPQDPTPLNTFVDRVGHLPEVYRPLFINRAMSGILRPGIEVVLIPKEEDGKS